VPLDEPPPEQARPRRRRRAVGPPGAARPRDSDLRVLAEPDEPGRPTPAGEDEHLRREVPPHHGG
jgi:hypothetical protein